MKAHEITSNDRLDRVLVKLCDMIIDCDGRPHSMVGAAVVDPDGRAVLKLGTPVSQDPELWCHAERTAIDAYNKQYGELPQGCVIVTTLSPCSDKRMELRYDESCTDLLEQLGIQRVHCGYMDPSQDNSDHKFRLSVTSNSKLQELCKRIGDAVLDRDSGHLHKQGVAEGKVKLYTDPSYFGAEVDDAGFDSLPIVNIPADRLVGFEPDSKMNQPKSRANVEKIVAGLEKGNKLPPLLVRKYKDGYQVLDGHHRFWAYKLSGTKSIPVRIVADKDIEEISKQGVAEDQTDPSNVKHVVTFTTSISPAATKSTVVKHYGRTKTFATREAAVAWATKKNQIYRQENKPGRFEAATITDHNTGQQKMAEGRGVKQQIEEFLDSLSPDDVGIEEFPGYRVHYEGFTDDCKSSADYQQDPDAVYQQVYNDFIQREGGKQPIESNMVGDEEYPILYSIFRIR